jgi:hypothetical protein
MLFMSEEEKNSNEEVIELWHINLDWYQENSRSFQALAQRCLCDKCRKKLKADEGKVTPGKLISAIKDCCSQQPEFITSELPVMESIFRVMLAGGNEPLDITQIGESLRRWRGGSPGSTPGETLTRLLHNDRYYGLNLYEG